MQIYGIGDIVKQRNSNRMIYFIITDISIEDDERDEYIIYEVMKIYPVEDENDIDFFYQKELETIAFITQKQHKVIMNMVADERNRKRLMDTPEYIEILQKVKAKPVKRKRPGRPKKINNKDDVIEYHKLETIDDCLDALNNLDSLHKMFGDESYIQLKEVVTKRLKELC